MREYIKRKMPMFMKRHLKVLFEKWELKKVETLSCDTSCLFANQISLEETFRLDGIKSKWKETNKRITEASEIPDGTGGVNPGDRRAIYYLISRFHPESTLEIGTHVGSSTTYIATALLGNNNSDKKRSPQLVSVDINDVNDPVLKPWFKYGTKYSPVEMIKKMKCGHLVSFIKSRSLEYLSNCQNKYDFIFLDGDHSAKTVYQEIPAALRLLNKEGVILLHDYFPNLKPLWTNGKLVSGPYLATERLKFEKANIEVLPLGELPWPTKLKSHFSSLALVVRNINRTEILSRPLNISHK